MTTIEARITEALRDHCLVRIFGPRCRCGMPLDKDLDRAELAAHQAAVVAGIVTEAQAEAWDAGYTTGNAHNGRRDANPYRRPE